MAIPSEDRMAELTLSLEQFRLEAQTSASDDWVIVAQIDATEETRARWHAYKRYRRYCVRYYYHNVAYKWWWTEQACTLRALNGILASMME